MARLYLSDRMSVGVGWGRTLDASLASFRPPRLQGVRDPAPLEVAAQYEVPTF